LTVSVAVSRLACGEDNVKLYTADRVLTEDSVACHEPGGVLVDQTTVAWVGPVAEFPTTAYPADLPVQALPGATLMPGLIDAHVHLGFDGGPDPVARMRSESDALQVALMLRSARELLSVGVTTARDLGARGYLDLAVRQAVRDDTARGPRLLTSGSPVTVTGGHCWFMGGEADSTDDIRRLVRRHHKAGVDLIKVMSTGGFMTEGSAPWHAQFELEQLQVAVAEAHRLGKRVAAHAHGVEGIERALVAGVDTLEHLSFVHPDGRHEVVPELVDRIAASRAYVSPTLSFQAPRLAELTDGLLLPALEQLYRSGCTIIASTDAGIDHTPHYGFAGALAAMVHFGMPAPEVITSATSRAAEALGIADRTGRLRVGLDADLIAVAGDPRKDIGALADLRLVVARGREFTPDPLPALEPLELATLPPFILEMIEDMTAAPATGTPLGDHPR
jgi:imidazolonepropionase-like amidohydrolase